MNTNEIKNKYFDALYFASSTINEKESFSITPTEFKLMLKLINYANNQNNITWKSEEIYKHTMIPIGSVDKSIQRLKLKGYIRVSTTQIDTDIKSRTIWINWDKIVELDDKYNTWLEQFKDTSINESFNESTFEETPTETIISKIQVVNEEILQVEEKVSQIEENPLKINEDNILLGYPIEFFIEEILESKNIETRIIKEITDKFDINVPITKDSLKNRVEKILRQYLIEK